MPEDAAVLTVEFKTNLIAPAQGEYFLFRACVLKPGRTITVCDGQAFAAAQGKEKLSATMTGTLMALFGRVGIAHYSPTRHAAKARNIVPSVSAYKAHRTFNLLSAP